MDNTIDETDIRFMRKALALAEKGLGMTSPNPVVGAVVVKNNRIIGQGYHHKAGEPHAEILALEKAGDNAAGGTIYVTLEPCCHYGKTPPCTQTIIKSRIERVVVGMKDPNPLVGGKGIEELENAGILVTTGVCEGEAKKINEIFSKYITSRLPFVTIKTASTLDGKIASYTGNSRWVTGKESREYVHQLRFYHDAIMVGIGTVLKDNPLLTCRFPGKKPRQYTRIIVDSRGKIPLNARVLEREENYRTIVATTPCIPAEKQTALTSRGAEVIMTEPDNGKVNLVNLFSLLGKKGISSIFLEGGGTLIASVISHRLADKLLLFIAPKIIGGKDAPTWVEGEGRVDMKDAVLLSFSRQKRFGEDVLFEYYFKNHKKEG